ncbi:class I SAM-dependent methyltransferase [Kitasatospora sp. NPDC004615]|uniref:class I SAM-dependent methyltransferase n=1 Tax=Kitasatospora sp. NPDC004615 TaxID=3364017 RepID=UPI003679C99B
MHSDTTDPGLRAMDSTAGYADAAEALVEQYESVSFAEVHRETLHLYPAGPAAVLDIGAGSGRDAAALAAAGHRVTAVEPTAPMRELGRARHARHPIDWVDDALPHLPGLTARADRYDLILLTAVWMHLDAEQRATAMATLAGLLADDGRIVLSLRHGPVPPGRRMFPVDASETVALARANGLAPLHLARREDPHARAGVSWTYLALHADRTSSAAPGRQGAPGLDEDGVSRS